MPLPPKKPSQRGTNNLPERGNPKGVVVSQADINQFLKTPMDSRVSFSRTQWQSLSYALNQRCLTLARSVGKKDSKALRDFIWSAGVAYDKAYPQASSESQIDKTRKALEWLYSKGNMQQHMSKGLGLVVDITPRAKPSSVPPPMQGVPCTAKEGRPGAYIPQPVGLRLGERTGEPEEPLASGAGSLPFQQEHSPVCGQPAPPPPLGTEGRGDARVGPHSVSPRTEGSKGISVGRKGVKKNQKKTKKGGG